MRYESFERRMKAVKLVKDAIHSARFWIIGSTALVAASTLTVLGVEGTVNDVTGIPESVVYGTDISGSASAALGEAKVLYAEKGSDVWSEVAPTRVGQYVAKGVSKNGYNVETQSKEFNFEITQKHVTIDVTSTSVTYGDNVSFNIGELAFQDRLSNISTTFEEFNGLEAKANIDLEKLDVLNEVGESVRDCYYFEAPGKVVSLNKRDIYITIGGGSKEYDGEALTATYELNPEYTLAENDSIEVTNLSSLTDISTSIADGDISIKNINGDDRTAYYNINKTKGTLEVKKRSLTIGTESIDTVYNGNKLTKEDLHYSLLDGSLLAGHSIEVVSYDLEGKYILPTAQENKVELKVVDAEGNDVSYYYNFVKHFGTVKIAKKSVSYTTASVSKVYDGDTLSSKDFEELDAQLPSTDEIKVLTSTCVDAESIGVETKNSFTVEIWNNVLEKDVSKECYIINETKGTLVINKRSVTVEMPSLDITYDGEEHKLNKMDNSCVLDIGDGLLGTDEVYLDVYGDDIVSLKNAQEYSLAEKHSEDYVVKVRDGVTLEDKTSFYNIEREWKVSNIAKRDIAFKTESTTHTFNFKGKYSTDEEATKAVSIVSGSLGSRDEIKAKASSVELIAGKKSSNSINFGVYSALDDTNSDIRYRNYNETQEVEEGTIETSKAVIKIISDTTSKVYDGKSYKPETGVGYHIDGYSLLEEAGYKIEGIKVYCDATEVSDAQSNIRIDDSNLVFKTKSGGNLSTSKQQELLDSFEIVLFETGQLDIQKRSINVTAADQCFEYDGEFHRAGNEAVYIDPAELPTGATYSVKIKKDGEVVDYNYKGVRDVADANGTGQVTGEEGKAFVQFSFLDDNGTAQVVDSARNLIVNYADAAGATATKRKIYLKTASESWSFNNENHSSLNLESSYSSYLASGEYFDFDDDDNETNVDKENLYLAFGENYATVKNVADNCSNGSDLTFDKSKLTITRKDDSGNNMEHVPLVDNYDVIVEYGYLRVKKAVLIVRLFQAETIYDGSLTGLSYSNFEITGDSQSQGAYLSSESGADSKPSNYNIIAVPESSGTIISIKIKANGIEETPITPVTPTGDYDEYNFTNIDVWVIGSVNVKFRDKHIVIKSAFAEHTIAYRTGKKLPTIDDTRVLDCGLPGQDELFFQFTKNNVTKYAGYNVDRDSYDDFNLYEKDASGNYTTYKADTDVVMTWGTPTVFVKASEVPSSVNTTDPDGDDYYPICTPFVTNDTPDYTEYINVTEWYEFTCNPGTIHIN